MRGKTRPLSDSVTGGGRTKGEAYSPGMQIVSRMNRRIGEEALDRYEIDRWTWDPRLDAALDSDGVVVLVAQGQPWSGLLYEQLTHEHNLACLARMLIPGLIAQH